MNAPPLSAAAPAPLRGSSGTISLHRAEQVAAMTNELAKRIVAFGMLLGWCSLLLVFRMHRAASFMFAFLEWNLFLAVIPAVAAWLLARAAARGAGAALQAFWFAVWLAFLPNAPYLLTDLIHLNPSPAVPLWFDLALLGSCGGTGLLLGYTSLADVQAVVARRFSARAGWAVAAGSLLLSGFGIYLGRFLRWNSWDAFTRPLQLLADIGRQLSDPGSSAQALTVTLIYGIGLLLGYVALRWLRTALWQT